MATVYTTWLIRSFQKMVDEKWKYEWGKHQYGLVDCQGSFTYWYDQKGVYIPNGSNTIARKYVTELWKIGTKALTPGDILFKWRAQDTEKYPDGKGDFHHVGLYIGDNMVIEAKGKRYGVVKTKFNNQWKYAGKLVHTVYDNNEQIEVTLMNEFKVVNVDKVFFRKNPNKNSDYHTRLSKGTMVVATGEQNGWTSVEVDGKSGYVMSQYLDSVNTVAEANETAEVVDSNEKITLTLDKISAMSLYISLKAALGE